MGAILGVCVSFAVSMSEAGAQEGQGVLTRGDAQISYTIVGQGAPLFVVHGGPGLDHQYLRPSLDVLASNSKLIYFDQRGTGGSPARMTRSSVTLSTSVEDIEALREALGFERIALLGHSFGSVLTLEYARRHPARTEAIVLVAPVEPGNRYASETADRVGRRTKAADRERLSELRASPGLQERDAETLAEMYRISFRPVMRDPDRVAEIRLPGAPRTAAVGQDVAVLLGGSLGSAVRWEQLTEIAPPVLVVYGSYDGPPARMSQAIAEAVQRGRAIELNAGHFPFLEDPGAFDRAVSSFLRELR